MVIGYVATPEVQLGIMCKGGFGSFKWKPCCLTSEILKMCLIWLNVKKFSISIIALCPLFDMELGLIGPYSSFYCLLLWAYALSFGLFLLAD